MSSSSMRSGRYRGATSVVGAPASTISSYCSTGKVLYSRETLNVSASPGLRESLRDGMRDRIERGHQWVLEADGRPVAKTSFNAAVATWVQVGGVFTPPDLRSRGYGRAVVAASLEDARAEGATNAVLFTTADNHAAQRAYEAIGFRAIGHYGLLVFSG